MGVIILIQIKNLNLSHTKDLSVIIDDLNLTLNKGDKASIIGEEGNGKSTLLKYIYDNNLVSDYVEASGTVKIVNETLAYLPQEMSEDDLNKTIYQYFLCDEFLDASYEEQLSLARKFSLADDIYYSDQIIKTCSGGEKIKLQLIKLLLNCFIC